MAGVRRLEIIIAGDAKGAVKAFGEVGAAGEKSEGKIAKYGKIAGAAFAGVAVAAGAGAVAAVHLADSYETAHAKLTTALKNTGDDPFGAWAVSADKAGEKFGYTSAETEAALAQLTTSTGSSVTAMKLLPLAQNLAAATGKDLATSSLLITKASEGQLKPLKALGIDLPIAAGGAAKLATAQTGLKKAQDAQAIVQAKIHDGLLKGPAAYNALVAAQKNVKDAQDKVNAASSAGTTIIDALGKKLKGNAAAQAETFGGKIKVLKAQLSDMGVQIGMVLIPILSKAATFLIDNVGPAFQKLSDWVKRNWPQISATAKEVFADVQQAIQIAVAWVKAHWPEFEATVMQVVNHVVTKLKPILSKLQADFKSAFAAIKAVTVVVLAVLVEGWRLFGSKILAYVKGTFDAIATVVRGVLTVLQGVLDVITGVFTGKWGKAWKGVKEIFAGVWTALGGLVQSAWTQIKAWVGVITTGAWALIKLGGSNIKKAWAGIWSGFASVVAGIWGGIERTFASGLNTIIRQINGASGLLSKIPGVNIPKIPYVSFGSSSPHGTKNPVPQGTHGPIRQSAMGGHLSSLEPSWVGERGPELFVPDTSGTIIPHGRTGGVTVEAHFHVSPGFGTNAKAFLRDLADEAKRDLRSGGPFSQVIKQAVNG